MNKAIKVLLINVAVIIGFTLLFFLMGGTSKYNANEFLTILGLLSLAAAVLDAIVAVILFITGPAQYDVAKGFLLSAGVLLLIGFASCSFTTFSVH